MQVQSNFDLKPFNTFGISAKAEHFIEVYNEFELVEVLSDKKWLNTPKLALGGGSNLLLTKNFEGLVIKLGIPNISLIEETDSECLVKVGAGEIWHQFVLHCIEKNWAGVENLSLIPGNVGAAPMQNIGAYGTEIDQVLHSVRAYLPNENTFVDFSKSECDLGYRTSIFKTKLKGQAYITDVTFRLKKDSTINTKYGAIEQELEKMNISNPSIRDVSNAVIAIRSSKLPDPKKIGNAGSFFKNPVVSANIARNLMNKFPEAPNYAVGENQVKIPAGWLIETAGWKGKTFDDSFGVHKKQALVLVNYKNATGNQIYDLSQNILEDIEDRFGILLEREVNIL